MEIHELETKFHEAVLMIEKKGKEYGDAKAFYNYLYDIKKIMLADCTKRAAGKSVAEKEIGGFTDPKYLTHLTGLKEAESSYLRLEAEYKRWQAQFDWIRSLISIEKEKMKIV